MGGRGVSLLPKFQISKYTPATPATPATFQAESSESSKSSGGVVPSEHKPLEVDRGTNQTAGPPCQICGATMTETTDIYGREWWTCWRCARSA